MSAKGEAPPCMTDLRAAICLLVTTFNEYAGAEGCKKTLNNNEFKTMIKKEMPELLQDPKCKKEIGDLFEKLDRNGDKKVDFEEFVTATSALACIYHMISADM